MRGTVKNDTCILHWKNDREGASLLWVANAAGKESENCSE